MPATYPHIEIKAHVLGGKPKIVDKRISVQNIVIWHEKMGRSVDEISSEYNLSLAEVHAALSYYFDHQDEIDQSILKDENLIKQLKNNTKSKLRENLIN